MPAAAWLCLSSLLGSTHIYFGHSSEARLATLPATFCGLHSCWLSAETGSSAKSAAHRSLLGQPADSAATVRQVVSCTSVLDDGKPDTEKLECAISSQAGTTWMPGTQQMKLLQNESINDRDGADGGVLCDATRLRSKSCSSSAMHRTRPNSCCQSPMCKLRKALLRAICGNISMEAMA